MLPYVGSCDEHGVRCILQRVVLRIACAGTYGFDFLADLKQCINEAIEFSLALALCWFDHDRTSNREAQRWSVESKVHHALCNVFCFDTAALLELAQVDNHFVSGATVCAGVQHRICAFETTLDVVRIEDGVLRCHCKTIATHHADVCP